MPIDFSTLDSLRTYHPGWRLLRSDHAPLVVSFLYRMFVAPNVRMIAAANLAEALEDDLFSLRQQLGDEVFPKAALDYLNDWASPDKGWLRRFYRQGSDEPQFDLTPATEKTIAWLLTLSERGFVGTESRVLTLFELLRQISEGSETDPAKRIRELKRRRDDIDTEIARAQAGDVPVMDDTAVKDRFQQFVQLASELLTDFREVEHNFRQLDRKVRERIALWEGGKGALLEEIMGERDVISDSDQGKSFRAFWDFLMSSSRQEEMTQLLERVVTLPAVAELKPDARTRRVHYDWLEAGEHTQRTLAQLSQQLRRFLDDQAWLENRRIMDILRGIEGHALALRYSPPMGDIFQIDGPTAAIELPLERPLYIPPFKPVIAGIKLLEGEPEADQSALYSQVVVDKERLIKHIQHTLKGRSQVTLRELVDSQPLERGLAELVAYLQLGSEFEATVDEHTSDVIVWIGSATDGSIVRKQAHLPRVIFVR